MGTMEVPADALYGASTMRAVLNFPISDLRFSRSFIRALGLIKLAAARTNMELELLEPDVAQAIIQAAQEVADGGLDDHFVVDIFQTGSGTSTNTNANEVIGNRATQVLNQPGKRVHPNDHVNMGQSSNDVIPTCIHLSALMEIHDGLIPSLQGLRSALDRKSEQFWPVIKTARTHLQDATPYPAWGRCSGVTRGRWNAACDVLEFAQQELGEVALGGTAVGTGINAHPEFSSRVCAHLSQMTGVTVWESDNHFQAQSSLDGVTSASGALRSVAISLHKIANDIRFLGSGPRAGLGELTLPEVQPGSSIMPGKVNPVIAESLVQVSAQVMGNDLSVAMAANGGYFELNTMMPVAGYNLLQSIALLATTAQNFADQCVEGLEATDVGPGMVERGLMLGTALSPAIGYDRAAQIAKEAASSGLTIREVARRETDLSEEELEELMRPDKMTEPGMGAGPVGG